MIIQNQTHKTKINNVIFQGQRLPHQSFETFQRFVSNSEFVPRIKDVFQPDNFVGAGNFNKVYSIPENPDFLIKFSHGISLKEELTKHLSLRPCENIYPFHNLGQEIAVLGEKLFVIIKQQGKTLGINNWHKVKDFSKKHLPEFIEKLKLIKGLNQDSFNNFTEEIKLIKNKKQFFDYHNPNNLLLDENNINIVDVEPSLRLGPSVDCGALCSLLDKSNFLKAYRLADDNQKKELAEIAKNVRDKIKIATKKESLSSDLLLKFKFKLCDIKNGTNEYDKYSKFLNFLEAL